MSFGERLKEARLRKGLTQKQLAEKLNIAGTTITGYEKNNSEPNMLTISKIIDILGVDANFLLQDESDKINYENTATPQEFEIIIKKYRALDEHGKKIIDFVLNEECERIQSQNLHTLKIAARDIGVQEMYIGSDMSNDLDQLPETDEDI